jgi:single-stranded-DNA-specific exonuclease
MKTWNILNKTKKINIDKLIDILLDNRNITTKDQKEAFLNPQLNTLTVDNVGIDKKNLEKAIIRIQKAIKLKEQIIVFGDYDVDGITGSAILWEVLNSMNAKVLPYIPHRIDEGYGLSAKGIENVMDKNQDLKLIITVDNGIVANSAVDFAKSKGIDVIVTDHHVPGDTLPDAHAIVHTTSLCGAGVAYMLSQELKFELLGVRDNDENDIHLELASLGTIADLVPLTSANRTIVKNGLLQLGKCKRLGLKELFRLANLAKNIFTVYEVGYIIAPRLNAAGRIESAMDSLRLLCTKDNARAKMLAQKLEEINTDRQIILKKSAEHAKEQIRNRQQLSKLIFIADGNYQQGVIGLIAGKLVEEFYRPAIVVSISKGKSKGSARSVPGFNIIEFLRSHSEFFPEVGGHPMAAGFSVPTEKLNDLKKKLEESADKIISEDILKRSLKIDCEIPIQEISHKLFDNIQSLAPFGMGNPEPVFVSYNAKVKAMSLMGKDKNHLKIKLGQKEFETIDAIGFGMGEFADNFKVGDNIDIAYTIDSNTWNGNTKLQLKLKDVKYNDK